MLLFKDQRARIDRYTLHRETTVDQHAAAPRLGAQNPARHLSRHRLNTDTAAEFVAQTAQSFVEAGVAAIEDMLGPHPTQERHLLRAPHHVDHRQAELLPEPAHHASQRAGCGGLNDGAMSATASLVYQRPRRER